MLKFERAARYLGGKVLIKKCLKEKEQREESRSVQEREEYLRRNGYSQAGIDELRRQGRDTIGVLAVRDREVQKQYSDMTRVFSKTE